MTYSQSTATSTQTQADDEQRRKQLVEALERAQDEVKASRIYVDGLEKQVKSKQTIIDAQAKRQTLSDEAIKSLQTEVETLRSAIEEQQRTLKIEAAKSDHLKKELDKINRKLRRSRSLVNILIVIALAATGTAVLK